MVRVDELVLVEYDISNGNIEELSFSDDSRKIDSLIDYGTAKSENVAEVFYGIQNFEIIHLHGSDKPLTEMHNRNVDPDGLISLLETELEDTDVSPFDGSKIWALDKSGCPDLLVYKQVDDGLRYKFVEVKSTESAPESSSDDRLRPSQIGWLTYFGNFPTKVAYVMDKEVWKSVNGWY